VSGLEVFFLELVFCPARIIRSGTPCFYKFFFMADSSVLVVCLYNLYTHYRKGYYVSARYLLDTWLEVITRVNKYMFILGYALNLGD
jgi:hypothetical protein